MKLSLSIAFAVVAASTIAQPLANSANSVVSLPKRNHESNGIPPDDRDMNRDSQSSFHDGNEKMDDQRSGPPPENRWEHESGPESGPGSANRDAPQNVHEHRENSGSDPHSGPNQESGPNSDPRSGPNPQSGPNSDRRSGPNPQMPSNPEHHPNSNVDQSRNDQESFHRDGEQRLQEQHPPIQEQHNRPQSDMPKPEGQDRPLSDSRPENIPAANTNGHSDDNSHRNTNNDSHNNNGNSGDSGNANHDGPVHEHTERVEHPNGNPNNIDLLTHDVVNDNRNGIHSNVVQRVSVSGNNVSGNVRGKVVEGAHGAVSNGRGNVIGTTVNNARVMDKKAFDMFKNSLPGRQFIPLF